MNKLKQNETKLPFKTFMDIQKSLCLEVLERNNNEVTQLELVSFVDSYKTVFSNHVQSNILQLLKDILIKYEICNDCMYTVLNQFAEVYDLVFKQNLGDMNNYGTYITNLTIPVIASAIASYIPTIMVGKESYDITNAFYCNLLLLLQSYCMNIEPEYQKHFVHVFSKAIRRDEIE